MVAGVRKRRTNAERRRVLDDLQAPEPASGGIRYRMPGDEQTRTFAGREEPTPGVITYRMPGDEQPRQYGDAEAAATRQWAAEQYGTTNPSRFGDAPSVESAKKTLAAAQTARATRVAARGAAGAAGRTGRRFGGREVADFWKAYESVEDPETQAKMLQQAETMGIPMPLRIRVMKAAGVGPETTGSRLLKRRKLARDQDAEFKAADDKKRLAMIATLKPSTFGLDGIDDETGEDSPLEKAAIERIRKLQESAAENTTAGEPDEVWAAIAKIRDEYTSGKMTAAERSRREKAAETKRVRGAEADVARDKQVDAAYDRQLKLYERREKLAVEAVKDIRDEMTAYLKGELGETDNPKYKEMEARLKEARGALAPIRERIDELMERGPIHDQTGDFMDLVTGSAPGGPAEMPGEPGIGELNLPAAPLPPDTLFEGSGDPGAYPPPGHPDPVQGGVSEWDRIAPDPESSPEQAKKFTDLILNIKTLTDPTQIYEALSGLTKEDLNEADYDKLLEFLKQRGLL